ncbi:MAG TPA: hypothetical protein VF666_13085 [Pyrinomonadaceae bacterium]
MACESATDADELFVAQRFDGIQTRCLSCHAEFDNYYVSQSSEFHTPCTRAVQVPTLSVALIV